MVEGSGFENRRWGNSTGGSNPSSSARLAGGVTLSHGRSATLRPRGAFAARFAFTYRGVQFGSNARESAAIIAISRNGISVRSCV